MNTIGYCKIIRLYQGKKVLITGNTGFKGAWLTKILLNAGATVIGYSLQSPTEPNLFTLADLSLNPNLIQVFGDVRDFELMKKIFQKYKPEIVLHLAAQPIVRDSYRDPLGTYSINVMGTVNICECVRLAAMPISDGGLKTNDWDGVRSFLNVTTDKVYKNNEWEYGYREDDPLDGFDPYSNSKSCSEMVTHSYKDSFFNNYGVAVSTARAGNVIGGGDFSNDRVISDCVKSIANGRENGKEAIIGVRNPNSIRPYQHILEPLFMYLVIAMKQYEDHFYSGYYNVGPDDCDCVTTGELVSLFCESWNESRTSFLPMLKWENQSETNAPHEANFLKLDCSRIKKVFGWKPRWHIKDAIKQTIQWTDVWLSGGDVIGEMNKEIEDYIRCIP